LDTIQTLQKEEHKLISTKDAGFILCEYKEEIEGLINMGLILKVIKENIVYIQLAPETWYMTTGQRPAEWLEENIIITPDFEVFIPYYFNPIVVDMFSCYGKLKNSVIEKQMLKSSKTKNKSRKRESKKNKYRYYISIDDYFLVFDIEESKKIESKVYTYSNFYEALKCNMPDIVRDELEKSFE
jgi:hypothetical protein